jgi:phosphoglycolate phosphatase
VPTRAILFDLDGTLVDTRAASYQLFIETNHKFALGIDTPEAFFKVFERNFFDSLAKMVPDPARAQQVKTHFMESLRTRYNPAVIPGMVDVVRTLAPQAALAVISTNGMETIRRILVNAGIATCFSHVFAGDVEPRKSVSIRRFLADQRYAVQRLCAPDYHDGGGARSAFDGQDVVLVTDTVGDISEAREVGIRAIGVAWGMHGEKQLLDAGAERVALWPQELVAWLRNSDSATSASCACKPEAAHAGACAAPPVNDRESASPPPQHAAERSGDAPIRRERDIQLRKIAQASSTAPSRSPVVPPSVKAPTELLSAVRRIVGAG